MMFRFTGILVTWLTGCALNYPAWAQEEASDSVAGGGAAASDPTSTVNFQDLRYRYFDLERGRERHSFETEGSYAFSPRFKITNELHGVHTDKSGDWETDFEELELKGIFLAPFKAFGVDAKFALGLSWSRTWARSTTARGRDRTELRLWSAPADSDRPTISRAGFRKADDDGGLEYYVLPEVWRGEVCAGLDAGAVAKVLADRGILKTRGDGKLQLLDNVGRRIAAHRCGNLPRNPFGSRSYGIVGNVRISLCCPRLCVPQQLSNDVNGDPVRVDAIGTFWPKMALVCAHQDQRKGVRQDVEIEP